MISADWKRRFTSFLKEHFENPFNIRGSLKLDRAESNLVDTNFIIGAHLVDKFRRKKKRKKKKEKKIRTLDQLSLTNRDDSSSAGRGATTFVDNKIAPVL